MQPQKTRIMRIYICTFISLMLSAPLAWSNGGENDPETVSIKNEAVVPELTVENVLIQLEAHGIDHADVVLRQAILETGWFKCSSCSLGTNNLFGFLYKGRYLKFENWVESIKYYKWWQTQLYTGGDYYAFLKKVGYATAPNYIQYLKNLEGTY